MCLINKELIFKDFLRALFIMTYKIYMLAMHPLDFLFQKKSNQIM